MPIDRPLTLSCNSYDVTAALLDGTVTADGYTLQTQTGTDISRLFEQVVRDRAFDVAELGFTFLARTMSADNPPFYALPVFLVRRLQHSTTYINVNAGIETPADLAGKTVGEFATFGHDMGVWPKGIFADEYGLSVQQIRWIVGGVTHPMAPMDFLTVRHGPGVSVEAVPEGQTLGPMLESGDISALISALPPAGLGTAATNVRRLFPDYEKREADYYSRTGIFPIMHLVVVKRDLIDADPGLARALFTAFEAAKSTAIDTYHAEGADAGVHPRFAQLIDPNGQLVGDGRWDYGVAKNRHAVDTFLRYHHDQGLSDRLLTAEDIFPAELMDT
ncbi:hypothetical protein ACQP1S_21080 [Micromonospora matsumotoense]|uniref:hypothetical protein n=1 Tax=Micromonospora matsumotoense TaxID=121616 RepID=UPI003D8E5EA0